MNDSRDVLRNWEEIKREEQKDKNREPAGVLDGVPAALPALLKAYRIGTKTSRVGFFWKSGDDIMTKIEEELVELKEALSRSDRDHIREELGDLMCTLVMLGHHSGVDAEDALESSNRKFTRRFRRLETILESSGASVDGASMERLEQVWGQVKEEEGAQPS